MRRGALVVPLGLAAVLAISRDAHAQSEARAQALFDEAKRLMAENDFARACPKLAESQRLDPSGGTLLHLGICHAAEGKTATAYNELHEAIGVARKDGRSDREAAAKARLELLLPKLTRVTIVVAPEARVEGLTITWDETPIREPEWGVAMPVDPGEHLVSGSAPGRQRWTTRVTVEKGAPSSTVAIPILAREEPSPAPPPASTSIPARALAPAPVAKTSSLRPIGLAVGGAGIVALGVAGSFEARSIALADDRDDAARAGDRATRDEKHESARSSQLVAMIAGGIGVAALGTGIALFLSAPSASGLSAVRVVPLASSGTGGLLAVGRF